MLTGRKAFEGDSPAGLIGAILERETPLVSSLQPLATSALDHIVQRCLAKDRDARWQSIGDVMRELEWVAGASATNPSAPAAGRESGGRRERVAWAAAAVLGTASIILGTLAYLSRPSPGARLQKLSILPPPGATIDRDYLALSPDGRFVGFFAERRLKRIEVTGGPVQTICDAPYGFGGTWSRTGVILFAPDVSMPLYEVSANGGTSSPVTKLDASRQETSHSVPTFLPDGEHFLYFAAGPKGRINAGTIGTSTSEPVVEADSLALYAPPVSSGGAGYLVYLRDSTLVAQPFNAERRTLTGDAVAVTDEEIHANILGRAAPFSVTVNGVLAYRSFGADTVLAWFDRTGTQVGTLGTPARYNAIEISPDGKRLAAERMDPRTRQTDVWMMSIDGESATQLTLTGESHARWSPDGRFLIFNRDGRVFRKPADGNGPEEAFYEASGSLALAATSDPSPDGRLVAIRQVPRDGVGGGSLFVVPTTSNGSTPTPIPQTEPRGMNARFSPDGRWLVHTSEEGGIPEVYLQPFPATGAKWVVSRSGGIRPRWRRDGKEIFYVHSGSVNGSGKLMAVPIELTPAVRIGAPAPVVDAAFVPSNANDYTYAVTPDGQRILVIEPQTDQARAAITVVMNWTAALKK
jgi:eukaryotic-like serine/threonine-protein kinase